MGSNPALTRAPERARRQRRWPWVLLALVIPLGLLIGWAWQQSREAELTSLSWDRRWGVRVEADYTPVLPTTITGATLTTDAGGGVGSLWDKSSPAADLAPEQVDAHWGRPVSFDFSFIPSCAVRGVTDTGVITLSTPGGERSVSLELPRLSDAVTGWCEYRASQGSH